VEGDLHLVGQVCVQLLFSTLKGSELFPSTIHVFWCVVCHRLTCLILTCWLPGWMAAYACSHRYPMRCLPWQLLLPAWWGGVGWILTIDFPGLKLGQTAWQVLISKLCCVIPSSLCSNFLSDSKLDELIYSTSYCYCANCRCADNSICL
jgi:hypothetical protein